MDKETDELIAAFVAEGGDAHDWRPSYNIRPTDQVPIVVDRPDSGERRLEMARWSLVPSWSKELKLKYPTFNARAETAAEKSSFRSSVVSQRAIIPVTGYYEWKTEGSTKTPFFVRPEGGELLGFAGLYSWWRDPSASGTPDAPDAPWMLTATILTSDTVPHLAEIHDRNPVMLPAAFWDHWLDPSVVGDQKLVDEAVAASHAVASSTLVYEVGPVRDNGPQLIEPVNRH